MPCVILLVPICWAVLCYLVYPSDAVLGEAAENAVAERRKRLGKFKGGERATIVVFGVTALAWIFREPKELGALSIPGLTALAPGLSDAAIGLTGALALFLIPARDMTGERRRKRGAVCAQQIQDLRGCEPVVARIAFAVPPVPRQRLPDDDAGPALQLEPQVRSPSSCCSWWRCTVLLSELASNTAVAAMAMPIAADSRRAPNCPPFASWRWALAASAGYALPIATPPNAIAYGSGRVTARQMLRAGIVMDIVAVVVIVLVVMLLGPVAG